MKKILIYLLLISLMVTIFCFSNEPLYSSSHQSSRVINIIIDIMEKVSNEKFSIEKRERYVQTLSLPIRKLAHFTLYFTLGVLFFLLYLEYHIEPKQLFILSILCCLLYACTDEIHQMFVFGRNGSLVDVLIDTFGSTCGIFVMKLLCVLQQKKDT